MASIMIVDDATDASEALAGLLQKDGHKVQCISNAHDALAEVMSRPPDVLMLDLYMPQMDGAQFLEVIRSYLRLQAMPVIVWTGLPDDNPLVNQARRLKASAILIKGRATFEDVEHAVEEVTRPHN